MTTLPPSLSHSYPPSVIVGTMPPWVQLAAAAAAVAAQAAPVGGRTHVQKTEGRKPGPTGIPQGKYEYENEYELMGTVYPPQHIASNQLGHGEYLLLDPGGEPWFTSIATPCLNCSHA